MQTSNLGTLFLLNAILGVVLFANVLVLLYVRRLRDERYNQILSLGGRNGFIFLMAVLPSLSMLHALQPGWIDPCLGDFAIWIVSFVVLYVSSFYYYYTR
ncbi:MAG: hypothetical protein ACW99U_13135 [Candidatus Thorarchaeota archaeon]|jgi:uncharacterized membrane protein YhaH (DUF805 family)